MRTIRKVTDISKARKKAKKGGWGLKKVSGSFYQTERLPKPKTTKKTNKKKSGITKTVLGDFKTTRKFGNERYRLEAFAKGKQASQKEATRLRNKGKKARVVKTSKGYGIYTKNNPKSKKSKK